jgi:RNA polymerase sigma-70 factor (ECF subfamily)
VASVVDVVNNEMSAAKFDASVTGFVTKLRAFMRARAPDEVTADDLTQETLLKVYRSRASLRDNDRLEAWLYRIARRTLIDHYRKGRPSEELPVNLKSESRDDVDTIRDTMLSSIVRFMEKLPDAYRIPLQLSELEEVDITKIAARLEMSLPAVKSRVWRGRQMLKKMLQECCHFEFDRHGKVIGWERRNPKCCD